MNHQLILVVQGQPLHLQADETAGGDVGFRQAGGEDGDAEPFPGGGGQGGGVDARPGGLGAAAAQEQGAVEGVADGAARLPQEKFRRQQVVQREGAAGGQGVGRGAEGGHVVGGKGLPEEVRVADDAFDEGDVQLAVQQGFLDPADLIHRHPDGRKALQAAAAAQRGDMAGAQAMLKPLLDDPQAAALLEKLKQGR